MASKFYHISSVDKVHIFFSSCNSPQRKANIGHPSLSFSILHLTFVL